MLQVLSKTHNLKILLYLCILLAHFSAYGKVSMPEESLDLDCCIKNSNNSYEAYSEEELVTMKKGLWRNKKGRIRDITLEEKNNSGINAVGIIKCKIEGNESIRRATGTLVYRPNLPQGKGPLILFAGHSRCNNKVLIPKENCVFLHTFAGNWDSSRYGKVYEHKFNQVNTKFKCDQETFENDLAVATLEDFDGYWYSSLFETNSINKKRHLDDSGQFREVKFATKDSSKDDSMLMVGYDPYHKKLMISENCGLFDKSEPSSISTFNSSQMTHDCLQTPGYSGGPIFQKKWNKKKSRYSYRIICVNGGDRTYYKGDHPKYRLFEEGVTGGRCAAIEDETLIELYKGVGAY